MRQRRPRSGKDETPTDTGQTIKIARWQRKEIGSSEI